MKQLMLALVITLSAQATVFAQQVNQEKPIREIAQSLVRHADYLTKSEKNKAYAQILNYLTKRGSVSDTTLISLSDIDAELNNSSSPIYRSLQLNEDHKKNFVQWSHDTGEDKFMYN